MNFKMHDLQDIGLTQWNTIGDHPEVTPFNDKKYKLGAICPICKKPFKIHGLLKNNAVSGGEDFDHFHGENKTTVCPGDYIYQTTNDSNVKQSVVIPPDLFKNIYDSFKLSYKERVITRGVTEIVERIYYAKYFELNSESILINNNDWNQKSETYTIKTTSVTWDTASFKLSSKDIDVTAENVNVSCKTKTLTASSEMQFNSPVITCETESGSTTASEQFTLSSPSIIFENLSGESLDLWKWYNEVKQKIASHEESIKQINDTLVLQNAELTGQASKIAALEAKP